MSRRRRHHGQDVTMHAPQAAVVPQRNAKPENVDTLGLSAYGAQQLSLSRRQETRMPDEVQMAQRSGMPRGDDRMLMEAYLESEDDSLLPVTIVNNVDDQRAPPFDFAFTNRYVFDERDFDKVSGLPEVPSHCTCIDGCKPATCECRMLHTRLAPTPWADSNCLPQDFAYTAKGLLHSELLGVKGAPIWECNEKCRCAGYCRNRVVGKPRTVSLKLARIRDKGWGVLAGQNIQRGQFVIVYSGELISDKTVNARDKLYAQANTSYILDIDPFYLWVCIYVPPYRLAHPALAQQYEHDQEVLTDKASDWYLAHTDDPILSVDAALWGNISRFISHSCDPNLTQHPVYTHDRDLRRPYMSFFACKPIAKGEELTFSYHDVSAVATHQAKSNNDKGKGKEKVVQAECRCGATNCCGKLFS